MRFFIKNSKKIILILGLSIVLISSAVIGQTNYYSKASGNANLEATWGTNTDGTGTPPPDFATGDVFIVRNESTLTTSATFTIDDAGLPGGGQLIINNGGVLTASHVITFSGAETLFQIDNGGRYVHNTSANLGVISSIIRSAGSSSFDASSIFEISESGTHTSTGGVSFGNFTISGPSKTVAFRTNASVNIQSTLTISNTCTLHLRVTSSIVGGPSATSGTGTLRISSTNANNISAGKTWNFLVNIDSSANQNIQGGTYTDINATGGNRTIAAAASIFIGGTFTIGLGTYTIGSGSTIDYTSNGSLSIPILPYQNLTISGTGTKSISAPLTISGTLLVSNASGFLDINGQTLTLNGDATLTNGKLIGSSTSNLTVSSVSGTNASIGFSQTGSNNQLHTLTLDRTGGGGAILQDNVNIVNRLIITAGNLNTNNSTLGLLSTSISATARVDQVTGSISYGGSGGFRVERFIPSGFRSYRDLTPSVYTFASHILDNWQEGGNSPGGYGTHITGVQGAPGVDISSGLDRTQTGNGSFFTYNGTSFPAVTNTASTRLDPYLGYRILIRGDRNVDLLQVPTPTTMNQATTLRATGELIYGDVTFSTSGVTNSVQSSSFALNSASSTGFSLIGNPYACPVSWGKILDNAGTTNVQSTYWYFDPTQGINGIYATWIRTGGGGSETGTSNGIGNTNNFIQSGQAIFVRNNSSTSPTVKFEENDKAIGSTATSIFSVPLTISTQNKIGLILQKYVASRGGNVILDGSTLLFDANSSNSILTTEDAGKISNGSENLAIVNKSNGTNLLSIESRKPVTENDTIALHLWQVVNNDAYTLNIIPKTFSANGRMAFLNDAYLKKQTFIRNDKDTIKINFTSIRTDSASYYNRFSLLFKQPSAISSNQSTASLTGTYTGTAVGLTWKTTIDNNQLYYELEKSTNGFEYTNIATIYSDGTGSYSFLDTSINSRKVYYRVRYYNTEAQYGLTNIVLIEPTDKKSTISVYPNPVSGNTINVQMNQLDPGNYQLAILDNHGRVLFTQQIMHQNNSSTIPVTFNRNFTNGLYRLKLTHLTSMKVYTTNIVFQSNK